MKGLNNLSKNAFSGEAKVQMNRAPEPILLSPLLYKSYGGLLDKELLDSNHLRMLHLCISQVPTAMHFTLKKLSEKRHRLGQMCPFLSTVGG